MHTDEYGPPRDEHEREHFRVLVGRTFGMPDPDSGPWLASLPQHGLRVLRGSARGGTRPGTATGIEACLGILDLGQHFGGRCVPMGGILAVAVEPWARGGGRAQRLMQLALGELHERGIALSALYPATVTLYRSVGYEIAGARHELVLRLHEARRARGVAADPDVWIRPLDADDEPAVQALYTARAARTNGWLARDAYLWGRVKNYRGELRQGFGVGHGKELEGYAFLAQRRKTGFELELALGDLVATTARSAARLLSLCLEHRSLCARATGFLAPSDPFVAQLAEASFESRLSMPWMLRITSVRAALEARGYAPALAGTLDLELADEDLPGNAGRWRMELADGRAHVERGGAGALELDARAFAALYTGWQSAEDLAASGKALGDRATLARASAFFAGPPPHMPDMF